ncbi:hypothetical protein PPL_11548 [Heterostelium album PN500]|uniref:Major facilitator superfamily (MFS) profile domain-containing protein n=1 Tax=Heterostelium pallidum (strain ATCC 26659 / Pp 5 / PN500) TaxID=670386 RepID=D3BVF7_HETP5|nr:hypothetical protein PPL_11548 [Heterostelium album PN500]EFA74580.1 hypothetical protein PPL_11548 [Heterostelium album PN500]|eukprot:XP_020426714.1 hypothetical protein PPL_11548 [Heterostelium album PN500]
MLSTYPGLVFGYNTGVIAGVLNLNEWKSMNEIDRGTLTCSILLGAMIGSLMGGFVTERLGRKPPLFVVGLLTTAGAIASALVPAELWYVSACRFVLGLGVGASAIICPLYVGEMADPTRKGRLGTIFQIAITIGIFVSDCVGFGFIDVKYNYRWMFAFGALPESHVWQDKKAAQKNTLLLLNVREQEQEQQSNIELSKLNDNNNNNKQLIYNKLQKDTGGSAGIRALLSKSAGRFALFMGAILAVNNQLTGINAFMYFSPSIFEQAGIKNGDGPMIATICLVGWNAITTLISTFLIDKIGRRKLMIYSSIIMTLACLILAILFLTVDGTVLGVTSIILLFIFIAGFEAGAGPLFWIMAIEIFPPECKDIGSSLLNALQWIFNIALSFSFLTLVTLIGQSAIFWIFGGCGVVCLIFMVMYLPETKQVQDYQPII